MSVFTGFLVGGLLYLILARVFVPELRLAARQEGRKVPLEGRKRLSALLEK
jgi:Leu/Phe-tRNA-protein transferase